MSLQRVATLLCCLSATPALAAAPLAPPAARPANEADALVAAIRQRFPLPVAARSLRLHKRFAIPGGGEVVRLQQELHGVPVQDAGLAARLDASGEVRWVSHDLASTEAVQAQSWPMPAGEAVRRAAALEGLGAAALPDVLARRVWLRMGASLVPAWRVTLPPRTFPWPSAPVRWLAAADGAPLRREDRVRFLHEAQVYPENPVSTPTLQTVTLPLPDGAPVLEGPDVLARNCVDRHATEPVTFQGFTFNVHMCSEVPVAAPDGNGDFLVPPAADTDPEDTFAEIHAYHHVTQAFAAFRALGFTQPDEWPLPTVVNFRIPIDPTKPLDAAAMQQAVDPDGPLFPFDNAFFLPAGDSGLGIVRSYDSIVFGQGTTVDFAYDGGVFHHEFGHAVVAATSALGAVNVDEFGLDAAPGSLNEAYADFFAEAYAGDPRMGEYAGSGFGAAGGLRDASNSMTCPAALWGEVHQDSNPFSGALWSLRVARSPAELTTFDTAVYTAMIGLPSLPSFQQAAEATIAELAVSFDATVAAEAQEVFATRGLLGCNDRVVDSDHHPVAFLEGTSTGLAPTPGYLQLRAIAPERAGVVVVSAARVDPTAGGAVSGGGAPAPQLVLKRADAPIHFSYDFRGRVTHDGDETVALAKPAGAPRYEARFVGDFPAGPLHFAFVNTGESGAQLSDVTIAFEPFDPGAGGAGGGGAGGAGGAGGSSAGGAGGSSAGGGAPIGDDDGGGADDGGGCGCGAGRGAPSLELAALLGALGLFFTRRRVAR